MIEAEPGETVYGAYALWRGKMDTRKLNPEGKRYKHLKGVVCDVKNCAYHDGDAYCAASRIAVGPSFAKSSGETVCATFKPKTL